MLTRMVAALLVLLAADADKKVALVLTVKGTVVVQAGEAAGRPVQAFQLLSADTKLSVGDGSEAALLFLRDKHRERIKPGSEVVVAADGCKPADAVARQDAVAAQADVTAAGILPLAGAGKAGGVTFRDLPDHPPAVTPMFDAAVLDGRPALSWKPAGDATEYRVRLCRGSLPMTEGRRGEDVWRGPPTSELQQPYPKEEAPLPSGAYSWYVSARTKEGDWQEVYQSQFSVLCKAQAAGLAQIDDLARSRDPADQLQAAVAYQERHVYDQALPLLEQLAQHDAHNGQFQAALADYYARAGRKQESDKALERAKNLGFEPPPR